MAFFPPRLGRSLGKEMRWQIVDRWRATPAMRAERDFLRASRRLRVGDIAIDCGANVGKYTRLMAATGATVHAIEPDPYCVAILKDQFKSSPNVVIHAVALGRGAEIVKLYRTREFDTNPRVQSQGSSLFASKSNIDKERTTEATKIDIVSFIRSLPGRVALMKLDVEGAEVEILESLFESGAVDAIEQIFAETHEQKIPELSLRTMALREAIAASGRTNINLDWK